ncbi:MULTISPECIES: hypothetical protein [Halomonas]|uniref:hypothetical protein n=1 Tax=Halomonas TaxID=2745 RepID=UPI001C968734|nr:MULTISPECIES: hypothetical protein [Halomonas]MBY6207818.1 hypothetical protein [Halomonas sp. DP3Y7-2]MBY6228627.1 hypothetical protein [Halomonas sp. DP3Y7-1]MCA0916693.1 hypothetical protein [Halomonas denitrificans]
MNDAVIMAIAALFLTSLLVRVLPATYNFRFSDGVVNWLETILPSAIFLNFIAYIFLQEMQIAIGPALFSLSVTVMLAYWNLGGLFVGVLGGSVSYYLLTVP